MKYKKEITITIIISILVLFLRYINVLQIENGLGNIGSILILISIFSFITIFIQRKIDENQNQDNISYDALDILKYICSILIIILHLRPFQFYSDELDLAFNNIVTRVCVPMFFIITGYFVSKKEKEDPTYIKKYIKKMIPLYLLWSLLYLPILPITILEYRAEIIPNLPNLFILIPLIPLALLICLLYTGVYYHLWYFPAVIFSLLTLDKLKKKINIKYILVLSFILLLFGATETYFGILPTTLQELISYYFDIFFTTRNFLFFGLFYVVLGYYIGSKKIKVKYSFVKFIVACFFITFEAILLHDTNRLDSNILLSCIPLTYYLFISLLYIKVKCNSIFRKLSKYYYLIHPMIIFIIRLFGIESPYLNIFLVILITHTISYIIIKKPRFF